MLKRIGFALLLAVTLSPLALPALASQGGGGGVHFGPYSLSSGDMVTGDLVVFGPVTLGEDAMFNGDLVAFGEVTVAEGAAVTGDLVCFGATGIAGSVEGSVFAAGSVDLGEGAEVEGDVNAVGTVSRTEGAMVEGTINENTDFDWGMPFVAPFVFAPSGPRTMWRGVVEDVIGGMASIVVLVIFALIIAAIWPTQMTRVGRAIVEEPLPSFGVGALSLLIALVGILILTLTICLIPVAILAGAVVALGLILGWVALGAVLGDRILRNILRTPAFTTLGAAVLGTTVLTVLAVLVNLISGCLYILVIFPLFALAGGAVALTRFGSMPYASRGALPQPAPGPQTSATSSAPVDRTPQVPDELKE